LPVSDSPGRDDSAASLSSSPSLSELGFDGLDVGLVVAGSLSPHPADTIHRDTTHIVARAARMIR
jgi:hypothetical protein